MPLIAPPRTKLFVFMKFGEEPFMRALYDEGVVYMNTVQFFREQETATGRGDPDEGMPWLKNYPPGEFRVPWAKDKVFHYLALQVRAQPKFPLGNIYSLYSFASHHSIGRNEFRVDALNKELGSHMVLIHGASEFLRRWKEAMRWKQLGHERGFVSYYDLPTFTGGLNVFWKSSAYAYQQEYRLHAHTISAEPLVLRLGSLHDIADIYPADVIDDLVFLPK